ncbi:MAG: ABC transporter substrate-binding protein [Clostridiales bacterium]|nr:ABC transporter substrate-binding protein [Clostridiales bacterium]
MLAALSSAASAETIKIGAIFNLTGGQASLDQPSLNGFQMAADEINAAGGIGGAPVEVVAIDGKTEQDAVSNAVTKMIDVENVVVVAGLSDSNYALAAGMIAQEAGIPFVTSGATLPTLPDLVGDMAFLAPFGDNVQAYACAEYLFNDLGYRNCYLLTDMSMEFTTTLAFFFQEKFVELGGTIVLEDVYMNKDPDFSAQIDRFLAEGKAAEAIFIAGVPDDAGVIVKQFRDKGAAQTIISGDGFDTPLLMEVAGEQAEGVLVGTHASLNNASDKVQNFVKSYAEKYGNAPENAFAALGYDTMYLLADAIGRAGSTDGAAIAKAIGETSGLEGVTGTITYVDGSHVPMKSVTINVVKDGEFEFVKEITF